MAADEDTITTLLEEEIAAEAAIKSDLVKSSEAEEQAESTRAEGKPADADPTHSET